MKEKFLSYLRYYIHIVSKPILLVACSGVTALSLWSFRSRDVSVLYYATNGECHNALGYFGSSLAAILVYLFGLLAYAVPLLFLYALTFAIHYKNIHDEIDKICGIILGFFVACCLCTYYDIGIHNFSINGGIVGNYCLKILRNFDCITQAIILYVLMFIAIILIVRFAHLRLARSIVSGYFVLINYMLQVDNIPAQIIRFIATLIASIVIFIWKMCKEIYKLLSGLIVSSSQSSIIQFEREDQSIDMHIDQILTALHDSQQHAGLSIETSLFKEDVPNILNQVNIPQQQEKKLPIKKYVLPDIEKMLSQGNHKQTSEFNVQQLSEQAEILEEKLSLFGVKGKVVRVHPGPVITLYEYKPDIHIKLSKILGLEDDLAMALQALSIRIIAPIPGKDVVGFEVSNKIRKSVLLSDIFHSNAWMKFKGSLPLILGEDTAGNHMVVDLASMPHLLIAGSTGSGKSVALNCMLVSLLCAKKPENLKLIIIDPKQIEFTAYEKIAHLLFPVVNDPKKALPIFKWLVMTMEERYDKMAQLGVKNIFDYHKLEQERSDIDHMPFIVVMIDELADLMMTTGKDIEGLIARIAQMSRAAGIHMIVATQRPSVDVITGLIKVNFPNRISFKVTSKVDSRTILDEIGAERLLGKGDMLFIDAKDPHMKRVHGAYVSDKEIAYLVSHIESQQPTQFLDIADFFATDNVDDNLLENDQELFNQVLDMLKDCDEVSISMLQRRFRIGFNRSARIIETLEARGLIMQTDGGKMRRVVKD